MVPLLAGLERDSGNGKDSVGLFIAFEDPMVKGIHTL